MNTNQGLRIPLVPFYTGTFLLVLYFAMAWHHDWFQLPNFYYAGQSNRLHGIASIQALSMLWKFLLLLPATVLLAWALSASGLELKSPRIVGSSFFPLYLSFFALIILVASVLFVFHATEVTDDELAYVFQAKTYLAGRLFNPPPPSMENFSNTFIINDGIRFIGKYQFGHPLLLSIGLLFGSEYCITIPMSAALIFLVAMIARELYQDRRVALVAPLFLFISPFFYLVSSSRLSHISAAFLLTLFFYLFLRIPKAQNKPVLQLFLSLIAGTAAGLVMNMRPVAALAFLLPFLVIIIKRLAKKQVEQPITIAVMSGAFLLMVALTLAFNDAITGSYLTFPMTYYDPFDTLAFWGQHHNIVIGIQDLVSNIARMNAFLFGFPVSLMFVFFQILNPRPSFGDTIAFAIVLCFSVGYLLVQVNVADLGPIYYYECIIPLVLLSARGYLMLQDYVQAHLNNGHSFARNFLFLSLALSLLTFVPERVAHVRGLTTAIAAPYTVIGERNLHNALVFMPQPRLEGWVFGFRNNAPSLDNDVICCQLLDPKANERVLDSFKGRDVYVFLWYGSPLHYDLRNVTREELLSTPWPEEVQKLWRMAQPNPTR